MKYSKNIDILSIVFEIYLKKFKLMDCTGLKRGKMLKKLSCKTYISTVSFSGLKRIIFTFFFLSWSCHLSIPRGTGRTYYTSVYNT